MSLAGPVILPGIRFEPQPPPSGQVLPRMDIAAFVGIAARGPLDVPVAVEDLASFTAVFGSDLVIGEVGAELTAQLRPAVAAFFRNGGHRCWVVRVAGATARPVRFPVPGLLRVAPATSQGRLAQARPAVVQASSAGSWAMGLRTAAVVETEDLALVDATAPAGGSGGKTAAGWTLLLRGGAELAAGDVLRIARDATFTAFAVVEQVHPAPDDELSLRAVLGAVEAFEAGTPEAGTEGRLCWFGDWSGEPDDAPAPGSIGARVAGWAAAHAVDGSAGEGEATVRLTGRLDSGPRPADWVRFEVDALRHWWLVVAGSRTILDEDGESVLLTGPAFRQLAGGSTGLRDRLRAALDAGAPGSLRVERLRLGLVAGATSLDDAGTDLGLAPGHPRYAGALPGDAERFGNDLARTSATTAAAVRGTASRALAGTPEPGFLVPLALGAVPAWTSGAYDPGAGADPDGLRSIEAATFVDRDLADVEPARLLAEADFLRYQAASPRTLRGMHALLGVEEATIVAVPDATLVGWIAADDRQVPLPVPGAAAAAPDETFEACDPGTPGGPEPHIEWTGSGTTRFRVAWAPVPTATAYAVQETVEPATWSPPVEVALPAPGLTVLDAPEGRHRYRVRAANAHGPGPWSGWIDATVRRTPALHPAPGRDLAVARAIHRPLLRMCAARGDMFALLSLPAATSAAEAVDHATGLRDDLAPAGPPGRRRVPSPDADPLGVLSFGALYHPWIVTVADPAATGIRRGRDSLPLGTTRPDGTVDAGPTATGAVRPHPPDGAMAGIIATRARERGAWVAAANVPIRDVVAVDHPVSDADLVTMHAAGINVVRRTPAGFLVLAASTLSEDRLLRNASVRRLLALLRRLALLVGPDYVFEPNGPAFRRRVERGFEAILALLFERGAFAGGRAADAYRVVVGDPPNSARSVDAGQLIVELRVAPSVPLEFLTVRLVRSGDRFAVEVV